MITTPARSGIIQVWGARYLHSTIYYGMKLNKVIELFYHLFCLLYRFLLILQSNVRPEVAKAIIQPSEEVFGSAVPSAVA